MIYWLFFSSFISSLLLETLINDLQDLPTASPFCLSCFNIFPLYVKVSFEFLGLEYSDSFHSLLHLFCSLNFLTFVFCCFCLDIKLFLFRNNMILNYWGIILQNTSEYVQCFSRKCLPLHQHCLLSPGNIWQNLETFLFVTIVIVVTGL